MRVLKQSTQVVVMVGPFLDKTDGVTEEAGLAGVGTELSKAGAAFGAGPVLGTLDSDGWYPITLTTTHTNTLGDLTIKVHDAATHLPVWAHFTVIPANAYDAMVSGSGVGMRSDVQGWLSTAPATPTTNGVPEVDLTHIAGAAVSTSTAQLGVNAVQAGGTAWGSGAITAASIATGAVDADAIAADAATEIANAVWDTDCTARQTAGTFGQAIGDPGADTNTIYGAVVTGAAGATVAADIIAVKSDTAAILADTGTDGVVVAAASKTGYSLTATTGLGNQTSDITGSLSGSVGSVTGAVGSVTANVNAVLINGAHGGAAATAAFGGAGGITSTITGNLTGSVGSVTGAVGSVTGAVGSVTGAVGSVTGLTAADVGAIKTQTDKFVFTVANQVDANIQYVNDVAVNGDGGATPWGP